MSEKNTSLAPFVCFDCRKSFKRPSRFGDVDQRPCPECGGPAHRVSQKFKAPPQRDAKQWAILRYLFEHGWRFQSMPYDASHRQFPQTMEQAREFVRRWSYRFNPEGTE